jgi:hypothetical protein
LNATLSANTSQSILRLAPYNGTVYCLFLQRCTALHEERDAMKKAQRALQHTTSTSTSTSVEDCDPGTYLIYIIVLQPFAVQQIQLRGWVPYELNCPPHGPHFAHELFANCILWIFYICIDSFWILYCLVLFHSCLFLGDLGE